MPPPGLPPGPLSLATARSLGLDDHQWRLPRLLRTTQSVRSVSEPTNARERAEAFRAALPPDVIFSHVTAAQLWGLPLPLDLENQVELDGDVVATRTSRVPPGSPLTDAVRPLTDALAARVRPRNKVLLTSSLELVRPGVRSPMESRSRLVFVDAGFPEPEVNGHVHAADGGWLAECDLLWRAQRVAGEYQGAVHDGIRARSRDAYRNGLLTDEGWLVLEIFAEDHSDTYRKALLLNRFARALDLDPGALRIPG